MNELVDQWFENKNKGKHPMLWTIAFVLAGSGALSAFAFVWFRGFAEPLSTPIIGIAVCATLIAVAVFIHAHIPTIDQIDRSTPVPDALLEILADSEEVFPHEKIKIAAILSNNGRIGFGELLNIRKETDDLNRKRETANGIGSQKILTYGTEIKTEVTQ